MTVPLRPWKWNVLPVYNGFAHEERVRGWQLIGWFLDNGWMSPAARCSISGSTYRVQYHCEDYYQPWAPLPVSQPIHLALHRRFREPADWRRIISRYAVTGDEWFCRLPTERVDLAGQLRAKLGEEVRAIFSRSPLPAGVGLPSIIRDAECEFLQRVVSS